MITFEVIEGDRDVVSFLEGMVDRAKRGEFEGVAIASICKDECIGTAYMLKAGASHPWARLLAAVTALQQRIANDGV